MISLIRHNQEATIIYEIAQEVLQTTRHGYTTRVWHERIWEGKQTSVENEKPVKVSIHRQLLLC